MILKFEEKGGKNEERNYLLVRRLTSEWKQV